MESMPDFVPNGVVDDVSEMPGYVSNKMARVDCRNLL